MPSLRPCTAKLANGKPCPRFGRGSRCSIHPSGWAGHTGTMPPGWDTTRKQVLLEEPTCRRCGAPSTEVDHIHNRQEGGTHHRSNLQALCIPCHKDKTASESKRGQARAYGGDGRKP